MLNLFYWGLFGSHLEAEWERENPEKAAEQKYIKQRWEHQRQLKKHPNAARIIKMMELEDYRAYVRRMLEIGGPALIKQFEDI